MFYRPIPGWTGPDPPVAAQGRMDLSGWDFKQDGSVTLSGEWDFFWQTFLAPGFEALPPDKHVQVPGVWNGTSIKGTAAKGQGYATYRLQVLLQTPPPSGLGIKVLDAATAFTLIINGKEIYRSGIPGKTAADASPAYAPGVLPLPKVGSTLDIIVHVSNFYHWQGGMWEPMKLGLTADLIKIRERRLFFDALLYGSIFIMGLYHLFLYRFRPREHSPLFFGLFCILTALRPLFHGERLVTLFIPSLPGFAWLLKLNYITFYLSVPLFSWYLFCLFPRQVSKRVVQLISLIGGVAALTPLVLPPVTFTALMPWMQYATITAVVYGAVCLIRAILEKEPEAWIFMLGFSLFFVCILNDILYTRQFISTTHLTPAGLFLFILCQAVILARRFSQAFSQVSRQQQELIEEMIQRKRAEHDLIQSESRYRMMADFMPIPLCETDVHLNIVYANRAALSWFGSTQEQLSTGIPLSKILAQPGIRNFAQLSQHLKRHSEFLILKKDGSRVWAQIEMGPILNQSMLLGHRICFVDLTERKKAEAASLHEAEQGKYILVGQVAGKMAHDFNNILSAVMGNTELSLMDCTDPEIRENLNIIMEQTRRGQMLTQNLVAYAKDQDPREECLNLNESMDLVLHMLRRDLEHITISKAYEADLPEVLADPGMIEQSLVNIIQNAVHAMSRTDSPELRIKTFCQDERAGIEITDNGCGIPERYHRDIYTPSFTLKGSRDREKAYARDIKGTGYGMANVKKYMDKHKGTISFTSVQGKGTTFTLTLPATGRVCIPYEEPAAVQIRGVQGKKILIVEDERAISKVFYNILIHPPFDNEVVVAGTGRQAMDLFDADKFDLVSMDQRLSDDITGMDVYRHIRQSDSTLPILFVSGNTALMDTIQELIPKDARLSHLAKPCDNLSYARAVEKCFAP